MYFYGIRRRPLKNGFLHIVVFFVLSAQAQTNIETVGELPDLLRETSGLIAFNGRLITHNDSGNEPVLYEFDQESLEILRTVTIMGATNTDWEALTQDDDFIYVGDIGNNNGDRTDLNILKIAKTDYLNNTMVPAETIAFSYEDQTDFTTTPNSDFDAEALFSFREELILLTKQWQQQGTVAYRIPKTAGTFVAPVLDTNQINGLVTDASYDETSNTLFLVGYSNILLPFFASFTDLTADSLFGGNGQKSDLDIGFAQVEALTRTPEGQFFITSEAFSNPPVVDSPSRLFRFSLDETPPEDPNNDEIPPNDSEIPGGLTVFKSFGSQALDYRLNVDGPIVGMGIFDASGRLVSYVPLEQITAGPMDISYLSEALYYLGFFFLDNSVIAAPFYKD